MHNNPFFLALLGLIALAVLWYSGSAAYRYYRYVTLTEKTPATDITWIVKEYANDDFGIHADYNFAVGEKKIDGAYTFKDKYYNAYAAEQQIKKYDSKRWYVWYQPSNPHHSALQKKFPTKECVSAMVLWGLFLYFLWLGFYVNKYRF